MTLAAAGENEQAVFARAVHCEIILENDVVWAMCRGQDLAPPAPFGQEAIAMCRII